MARFRPSRLLTLSLAMALAACGVPASSHNAAPSAEAAEAAKQIATTVSEMEQAVKDGDSAKYIAHVDLTDPVFALEHRRWADDWSKKPPASFDLSIDELMVKDNTAEGALTMRWSDEDSRPPVTASFPVRFRLGADGMWRYAGEAWQATNTQHFAIYTWANTEDVAEKLIPKLPDIYQHVTTSLDYEPTHILEIKLYDSETALIANTLLSLPHAHGWNEPGESLKLVADPDDTLLTYGVAHEFTHFIEFEWAGVDHSRMPWWLSEGLAVYVGSYFEPPERAASRSSRVRQSALDNTMLDWTSISDFKSTPVELWPQVYAQGYAFVQYVTETYGKTRRNEWLRAMAIQMDLAQASEKVLSASFDQLNTQFTEWLKSAQP